MKLLRLLPLLVLAACSSGAERAARLNALIGQPDTEVVRVMGVPSRTYEGGGHRFLAYRQESATVVGGGFFGGGFGYGPGWGYGPGFGFGAFPAQVLPNICETTFDVVEGRVVTWGLRGNACG